MKLVMVVTKLTGNEENDRARAQEYCRYAAHKGVIPVSAYPVSYTHLTLPTIYSV